MTINEVNNNGKPRLSQFYQPVPSTSSTALEQSDGTSPAARTAFIQHLFGLIGQRSDSLCNFVDVPSQTNKLRVVYRHYATLFFIFVVDEAESELGILDLIQVRRPRLAVAFSLRHLSCENAQVFVESLDRCFENVCELDLVFHFDEVRPCLPACLSFTC